MSDTAVGILSSPEILIHRPADILDMELPQHSRIRPLLGFDVTLWSVLEINIT